MNKTTKKVTILASVVLVVTVMGVVAVKYKHEQDIANQNKLILSQKISELKDTYNNGIKLMGDKKYLEAMDQFKKITNDDKTIYDDSQKKIVECKNDLITQNIKLANDDIKGNKFDEANKALDDILKVDADNSEAKKLKDNIEKYKVEYAKKKEKEEMDKKGIRPLGELRKKIFGENYMILSDNIPRNKGLSEEELNKYGKYYFVGVGDGKWEDPDEKLIGPDVIINGNPAYTVYSTGVEGYCVGSHMQDIYYLGVDGKGYSLEELQQAINNNTFFNKDGTEIKQLSNHITGYDNIVSLIK